jgi:chromatin remodeling complex protein RSC6
MYFKKIINLNMNSLNTNNIECGSNVDKKNLGFLQPIKMTRELADILECKMDDDVNRMQAAFGICSYIKEHELKNPENEREFMLDDTLYKLFQLDKTTSSLEYNQIQEQIMTCF